MNSKNRSIAIGAAVFLAVLTIFFASLSSGITISSLHMDGVFQTASSLYRLSIGNFPGRDFLPYLGPGPSLVLFPLYTLLGSTVAASTTSSYFTAMALESFEATLVFALVMGERRYSRLLLVFAGTASVLAMVLKLFIVVGPGNSLRPLRAGIPYFCAGLILLLARHVKRIPLRYFLMGVVAGAPIIWSNDYGVPTIAVMSVLVLYEAWYQKELTIRNFALVGAGIVIGGVGLFTLVTAGHPMELLRYNFKDVAGDQFWYFGNDFQDAKFLSIADLRKLLFPFSLILVATVVMLLVPRRRYVYLVALGWVPFLGGSLAIVGGHYDFYYYDPFSYWMALVVVLIPFGHALSLKNRVMGLVETRTATVLYAFVILFCFAVSSHHYFKMKKTLASSEIYVKELGGYLASDQKEVVEFARSSKDPIIEEYWGLTSAIRGTHGPWREDLAIAALGSQRDIAAKQLADWNGIVSTTRAGGMFTDGWLHSYQEWSTNENWWLIQPLLQNFEPVLMTPNLMYWKRAATPKVWPEAPCRVSNGPIQEVNIDGEDGYYDMQVEYVLNSKKWHRNILEQTNTVDRPNDSYAFISIDGTATSSRKPVYISKALPPGLQFKVLPENLQDKLVLKSCTAHRIVDYPPTILGHVSMEGFAYYGTRGENYRQMPD